MNRSQTLPRLAVPIVALMLLSPTVYPAAQAGFRAVDRSRYRIEVLHTPQEEAEYVADRLERFADDAHLDLQTRAVRSEAQLLERIARSDADLLVVAGDGATDRAGPGSGIMVEGDRVDRSAIRAAVARSDAGRFFFAVCGLGEIPADGRPITTFDGLIDMKVATVSAMSRIGKLYHPVTAEEIFPVFDRHTSDIVSDGELVRRTMDPVDPLGPRDSWNHDSEPYCYDHDCSWSRSDEGSQQERGDEESGSLGKMGKAFSERLGWMIEHRYAEFHMPDDTQDHTTYTNGRYWHFLAEFDFTKLKHKHEDQDNEYECPTIWTLESTGMPAFEVLERQLDQVPGVNEFTYDAVALQICGRAHVGMVHAYPDEHDGVNGRYDRHGAGGELQLQVGTDFEVDLGWSKWGIEYTKRVEFWAGVVGTLGFTLDADPEREEGSLTLYASLEFVTFGATSLAGWSDVSFSFEIGDWRRRIDIGRARETQSQSSTSGPSPHTHLPTPDRRTETVPEASYQVSTPDGDDLRVTEVVKAQKLTQANLNALCRNPRRNDQLSDALGTDACELPEGTVVNLGNEEVCEAWRGDGDACFPTVVQTPILSGSGPSSASGEPTPDHRPCRGDDQHGVVVDQPSLDRGGSPIAPAAHGKVCAERSDGTVSVQAQGQTAGTDLWGALGEENIPLSETSPVQRCDDDTEGAEACQKLGHATAVTGPATERENRGTNAEALVSLDADNAAVFYRACGEVAGLQETCVEGQAGAGNLSLEGTPLPLEIHWSPAAVEDEIHDRKDTLSPIGLGCDTIRWSNNLDSDEDDWTPASCENRS